MVFSFLKKRRRRRWQSEPLPDGWQGLLEANIRHWALLSPVERTRLAGKARVFVEEKHWEGCGGLEMTDEVRVTIAAQACVLLLGVEDYYFDGVRTIYVYPSAFADPRPRHKGGGLMEENSAMLGKAHRGGPIVLSWDEVLRGARGRRRRENVVIHEFAHHLDGLDGYFDGIPPLASDAAGRWHDVFQREYLSLIDAVEQGQPTLLDPYGVDDEAEFFAVATECFFCRPKQLMLRHAELYAALRGFYRLHPAEWVE